jgi:hypothetical protein
MSAELDLGQIIFQLADRTGQAGFSIFISDLTPLPKSATTAPR